jgi:hypothetical protein
MKLGPLSAKLPIETANFTMLIPSETLKEKNWENDWKRCQHIFELV